MSKQKRICPRAAVMKKVKRYRTIIHNCQELMLPLAEIRLFADKGWIWYCRCCGKYHCGYTAAGVTVTLDMLANYRKLVN